MSSSAKTESTDGQSSDNSLLESIAKPLLESPGVQRLGHITFLGILSPRYRITTNCPLYSHRKRPADDGTRLQHSIAVGALAVRIAQQLRLPQDTYRYAAAWGLVHDIATWPLSHTGEAAFSGTTGVQGRRLREMMIRGDSKLPPEMTVQKALDALSIDIEKLLALFNKERPPQEKHFASFWRVLRSPLTPDSLEGIWRSGRSFSIRVKTPRAWVGLFESNLFEPIMQGRGTNDAKAFWTKKSHLYEHFINRVDIVAFESSWSEAIQKAFGDCSLQETLCLSEERIITTILESGLHPAKATVRYKAPHAYELVRRDHTTGDLGVQDLQNLFLKYAKS